MRAGLWAAIVAAACSAKSGPGPVPVAVKTEPADADQRPAPPPRSPRTKKHERPALEVEHLVPDFHDVLRWPLPMMSHPSLEPSFAIAQVFARPGIGWLELCERGVHKRVTAGRDRDQLEYLRGWCAAIQDDVDTACDKLTPLMGSSVLGLGSAARTDLATILASSGDAERAERYLNRHKIRDVALLDLLAASYIEVGTPRVRAQPACASGRRPCQRRDPMSPTGQADRPGRRRRQARRRHAARPVRLPLERGPDLHFARAGDALLARARLLVHGALSGQRHQRTLRDGDRPVQEVAARGEVHRVDRVRRARDEAAAVTRRRAARDRRAHGRAGRRRRVHADPAVRGPPARFDRARRSARGAPPRRVSRRADGPAGRNRLDEVAAAEPPPPLTDRRAAVVVVADGDVTAISGSVDEDVDVATVAIELR